MDITTYLFIAFCIFVFCMIIGLFGFMFYESGRKTNSLKGTSIFSDFNDKG